MPLLDKQFYTELGKILKKERKKKGYSQQYVVDKLDKENKISKQTLSKYELGKIRMTTTTFNNICEILEIIPNDILNSIHYK